MTAKSLINLVLVAFSLLGGTNFTEINAQENAAES